MLLSDLFKNTICPIINSLSYFRFQYKMILAPGKSFSPPIFIDELFKTLYNEKNAKK